MDSLKFGQKIKVLVTGGGAPGAPGIISCLQHPDIELYACDAEEDVAGNYLCQGRFFTVPKGTDPLFARTILDEAQRKGIDVILPLVTRELFPLSRHREEFAANGISVIVSAFEGLEIANDKGRLHQFLDWRGIPTAAFRIIEEYSQLKGALSELGYPETQLCFKPCISNGSRGFRIISDSIDKHDLLFNQKPSHVYISSAEMHEVLASKPFPPLLINEYLPGDEFSVDCLIQDGRFITAVPRLRKRMLQGISIKGEVVRNDEIIEYCRLISESLMLHGNIGIQVKADRNGNFRILEINPRVQGTIVAARGAGINLPLLAVYAECGNEIKPEMLKVKWGTKFIRYWEELYY